MSVFTEDDREILRRLAMSKAAENKYLGMQISDWLKIIGIAVAIIIFCVRSDEAMQRLITATDRLATFAENSDNFHSAYFGVPFRQGQPVSHHVPNRDIDQKLNVAARR